MRLLGVSREFDALIVRVLTSGSRLPLRPNFGESTGRSNPRLPPSPTQITTGLICVTTATCPPLEVRRSDPPHEQAGFCVCTRSAVASGLVEATLLGSRATGLALPSEVELPRSSVGLSHAAPGGFATPLQ